MPLIKFPPVYRKISMARGGKATAKKSPAKSKTKPKPTTKNASPVDSDAEYGVDKDLFNSSLNEKYKTPPGPYTKRLRNTITPSKNATTGIVQAAKNRRAAVPAPTATSADERTPTRGRSAARNRSSSPVPGPSGVRALSQPSAPSNSEFGIPIVSKFQANRQGSYDPAFGNHRNSQHQANLHGSYDPSFGNHQSSQHQANRQGSYDPSFDNRQNPQYPTNRPRSYDPGFVEQQNPQPQANRQGSYDPGLATQQNSQSRYIAPRSYVPGLNTKSNAALPTTYDFSAPLSAEELKPQERSAEYKQYYGDDGRPVPVAPPQASVPFVPSQGASSLGRAPSCAADQATLEPPPLFRISPHGSSDSDDEQLGSGDEDNKENGKIKGKRGRISDATKTRIMHGIKLIEQNIATLAIENKCGTDYIFRLLRPQSHGLRNWNRLQKMLKASDEQRLKWIPSYVSGEPMTAEDSSAAYTEFSQQYTDKTGEEYLDLHSQLIDNDRVETRQHRTRTFRNGFDTMKRLAEQLETLEGINTLILAIGDTIEEDRSHVSFFVTPRLDNFLRDFIPTPLSDLVTMMKASTLHTVSKEVNIDNMRQFIKAHEKSSETANSEEAVSAGSAAANLDKDLEAEIRALFGQLAAKCDSNWPIDTLPWSTMNKKNLDDGIQVVGWLYGVPTPGETSERKGGKKVTNAGFGHAVLKRGKLGLKAALLDKGPNGLKFIKPTPSQTEAMRNGEIPYLVFTSPPWDSTDVAGKHLFHRKGSDSAGPARLPPPAPPAAASRKRKDVHFATNSQVERKMKQKSKKQPDILEDIDEKLEGADYEESDEEDDHELVFSPPHLRPRSTRVKEEETNEGDGWSSAGTSNKRSAEELDELDHRQVKRPRDQGSSRRPLSSLSPGPSSNPVSLSIEPQSTDFTHPNQRPPSNQQQSVPIQPLNHQFQQLNQQSHPSTQFQQTNQQFQPVNQQFQQSNQQFQPANQQSNQQFQPAMTNQQFLPANQSFQQANRFTLVPSNQQFQPNQPFQPVNQQFDLSNQQFDLSNQQFQPVNQQFQRQPNQQQFPPSTPQQFPPLNPQFQPANHQWQATQFQQQAYQPFNLPPQSSPSQPRHGA
ncbi:hypothetical protein C8J56DRAFT_1059023 [Mycena floridula]|nr:hypothetical protein C8J56DRAFT_1059023 [Mycena floridula]